MRKNGQIRPESLKVKTWSRAVRVISWVSCSTTGCFNDKGDNTMASFKLQAINPGPIGRPRVIYLCVKCKDRLAEELRPA